jgi:magnesium-protoporphyrin IX monomethyl ester (oxidative) cyclase
MTMKKVSASEPATGPVISLDEVVTAAWSISMDILMRMLYRNELIRNNPGLTGRQVLALLADRDIRNAGFKLAGLYRSCVQKKSKLRTKQPTGVPA